ncbi:MAG TPA: adenosylcobinamide-GDP ribazoletransferase [Methanoregulaceae archaeon]|nr:adenosylcobinamide-GDP ribazoletransferase [Methanoregulaceae archaeon]
MPLKSIISLLQFTTVLPLGKPVDLFYFARRSYLYPLAGYVTGGAAALFVFWIPVPAIAAAVGIAFLFLITGCNHLDGLLDLGDGVMAHGSREKRIAALTDRTLGSGAFAFGVSFTLISFAGLLSQASIVAALIACEVGAKFSMAFLTAYGRPFREGLQSFLNSHSRPIFPFIAFAFCLPLLLLPLSPAQLAATGIAMVVSPAALLFMGRRLFGGINGDVVGASNEITRAVILVLLALV